MFAKRKFYDSWGLYFERSIKYFLGLEYPITLQFFVILCPNQYYYTVDRNDKILKQKVRREYNGKKRNI